MDLLSSLLLAVDPTPPEVEKNPKHTAPVLSSNSAPVHGVTHDCVRPFFAQKLWRNVKGE